MSFTARPLTAGNWADFEAIFTARGCSVARHCWCTYYRKRGSSEWMTGLTAEMNREAFKAYVEAGGFTGLVGYRDGTPVGWVSFGPREDFDRLATSQVMGAVDGQPVWSVICFVVPSEYRKQGVAKQMLAAAVAFCRDKGVKLLEAYPVDKPQRTADSNMWFGSKSMFDAAGFEEVARRKPERPIVRLKVV